MSWFSVKYTSSHCVHETADSTNTWFYFIIVVVDQQSNPVGFRSETKCRSTFTAAVFAKSTFAKSTTQRSVWLKNETTSISTSLMKLLATSTWGLCPCTRRTLIFEHHVWRLLMVAYWTLLLIRVTPLTTTVLTNLHFNNTWPQANLFRSDVSCC